MIIQIKDIATITSGVHAQFGQFGTATYLQSNFFTESGDWKKTIHPNLVLDKQTERHLLREGDILFAAKGAKNFATIVTNKMGACVASSTFLVIRIKAEQRKSILPEFMVWFLNHPNTLSFLKSKAIGSGVPSISKRVLDETEIVTPDLNIQHNIIIIDNLRKREKHLKNKIEELRQMQIQKLLFNLTTGNTPLPLKLRNKK